MMQAYDIAVLADKFKARGLDLAEDAVKGAVVDVLDWFEASAKLSATPFDDVALVVVPQLKKSVLELADKIDGVDDPEPV